VKKAIASSDDKTLPGLELYILVSGFYTPGRGKIVPHNVITLLVGEKIVPRSIDN